MTINAQSNADSEEDKHTSLGTSGAKVIEWVSRQFLKRTI